VPAAQYELTFPLVPRRRLIGLAFGTVRSARRGPGSDIASSRPYRAGDDVDAIDWRASAKISSARGTDEFIVRERFAEEAPRVVVFCDRRPEMALYPPGLPWLSKPAAMLEAGRLIADSTAKARGLVGYLDYAHGAEEPFWRPPHSQQDFWRVKESHLRYTVYEAQADNLARGFEHLTSSRRSLPPGSFVFVLSDFLDPPDAEAWMQVTELPWEIVPVVIQDPTWEQTFPDVSGIVVPFIDPATGRVRPALLSAAEVEERRRANEERFSSILSAFRRLDMEPVVLDSPDPAGAVNAFLGWADRRFQVRGRAT
jgi:hypothetical protein